MDAETMTRAIEAQFLMGHCAAAAHVAVDRTTITQWSWDVDIVRQQLHVPANALWEERVFALEMQGLASFCGDGMPSTAGWEDEPRERWGSVNIHARGVLRLAELYGRPYVKLEESPALLAHWQLVQAESTARLQGPWDEAQWAKDWPERALLRKARLAQEESDHGG